MTQNDVSRAPRASMTSSGLWHTKSRTKYVLIGHLAMRSTFCLVKPYAQWMAELSLPVAIIFCLDAFGGSRYLFIVLFGNGDRACTPRIALDDRFKKLSWPIVIGIMCENEFLYGWKNSFANIARTRTLDSISVIGTSTHLLKVTNHCMQFSSQYHKTILWFSYWICSNIATIFLPSGVACVHSWSCCFLK